MPQSTEKYTPQLEQLETCEGIVPDGERLAAYLVDEDGDLLGKQLIIDWYWRYISSWPNFDFDSSPFKVRKLIAFFQTGRRIYLNGLPEDKMNFSSQDLRSETLGKLYPELRNYISKLKH